MVLATLPKVAAEVAAPLANVERIKIVSGDGKDVGISRITGLLCARPCLPASHVFSSFARRGCQGHDVSAPDGPEADRH
jgi:hypothetical protein